MCDFLSLALRFKVRVARRTSPTTGVFPHESRRRVGRPFYRDSPREVDTVSRSTLLNVFLRYPTLHHHYLLKVHFRTFKRIFHLFTYIQESSSAPSSRITTCKDLSYVQDTKYDKLRDPGPHLPPEETRQPGVKETNIFFSPETREIQETAVY